MNLSVDQFSRFVSELDAADRPENEQRRQPRAGVDSDASIIPLSYDQPGPLSISVRDLSCSGLGFLHDRRMALDEQFALVLTQEDDTPAIVLCEVIFWQPLVPGVFAIGTRFVRILRDANTPLPIQILPVTREYAGEFVRQLRKAS